MVILVIMVIMMMVMMVQVCGPVASTAAPPTTTPSPDKAARCPRGDEAAECELPWCCC